MTWKKIDNYHICYGDYTICKIYLGERVIYELWHKEKFLKRADNSETLKSESASKILQNTK
jgi:hypothetical protein